VSGPIFSTFIGMEPRGKQRPRFVQATGRTYTPSETVKAELRIQQQVQEQWGRAPLDGPLSLVVTVWLQKPKSAPRTRLAPTGKPDWDNYGKLVSDALNGILWRDDALICRAFVEKVYCNPGQPLQGFQITVQELGQGWVI